jgi:hypothetical protein
MDKGDNAMTDRSLPAAWRIAIVWALLSMLGVAFAMPFLLSLLEGLETPNRSPLPPLPILTLVLILQTGILSFFLAWGGTAAGRRFDVGSPLIESWLSKRKVVLGKSFGVAALLGAISGLSVIAMDAVFAPYMPASIRSSPPQPTPFQGLLASLYGGISEEVMMRLGAATMAAWLISKVIGVDGRRRTISLAFGVCFGAIVFGAAHLPLAFTIWPASSIVVARILLLNAAVGVVAGIVYVRRGLEHAVVLHFAADIVLYVLKPIVQG